MLHHRRAQQAHTHARYNYRSYMPALSAAGVMTGKGAGRFLHKPIECEIYLLPPAAEGGGDIIAGFYTKMPVQELLLKINTVFLFTFI